MKRILIIEVYGSDDCGFRSNESEIITPEIGDRAFQSFLNAKDKHLYLKNDLEYDTIPYSRIKLITIDGYIVGEAYDSEKEGEE